MNKKVVVYLGATSLALSTVAIRILVSEYKRLKLFEKSSKLFISDIVDILYKDHDYFSDLAEEIKSEECLGRAEYAGRVYNMITRRYPGIVKESIGNSFDSEIILNTDFPDIRDIIKKTKEDDCSKCIKELEKTIANRNPIVPNSQKQNLPPRTPSVVNENRPPIPPNMGNPRPPIPPSTPPMPRPPVVESVPNADRIVPPPIPRPVNRPAAPSTREPMDIKREILSKDELLKRVGQNED